MRDLGMAIKLNASIGGNLVWLNILDNPYHSCNSSSDTPDYFTEELYLAHISACDSCPATWLYDVVAEVKHHPTMTSLFGLELQAKCLKLNAGTSVKSPMMWALFGEIARHQALQRLDLSSAKCSLSDFSCLGNWFHSNSLLRYCSYINDDNLRAGRDLSFQFRLGIAVFVRGCSFLGGLPIRNVVEFVYGVGFQSSKFLKYQKDTPRNK